MAPCLAVVLLAFTVPAQAQDEPAVKSSDYYPTKVGTTWKYAFSKGSLVNTVTKHEKIGEVMCARLETSTAGKDAKVVSNEHVAVTDAAVERHATLGFQPDPPVILLKLPAKKGDKWEIDSKVGNETIKGTAEVDEEEVKVKAGTYKTFKVTTDVTTGGMQIKSVCWYAKDVGMVKQDLTFAGNEVKLELEEYTAGK